MKNKVSFDFDATLSRPSVQAYAKELVDKGFEVWIVTLRFENPSKDPLYGHEYNNDELYRIADNIGIRREHIVFTGLVDKGEYFSQQDDFIFHLDDNFEQIKHIRDNAKNVGCVWLFNFSLDQSKWIEECNELIKQHEGYQIYPIYHGNGNFIRYDIKKIREFFSDQNIKDVKNRKWYICFLTSGGSRHDIDGNTGTIEKLVLAYGMTLMLTHTIDVESQKFTSETVCNYIEEYFRN